MGKVGLMRTKFSGIGGGLGFLLGMRGVGSLGTVGLTLGPVPKVLVLGTLCFFSTLGVAYLSAFFGKPNLGTYLAGFCVVLN